MPCCIPKVMPSQGDGEQLTKLGGPCAAWPHPEAAWILENEFALLPPGAAGVLGGVLPGPGEVVFCVVATGAELPQAVSTMSNKTANANSSRTDRRYER